MVATTQRFATDAGLEILRAGGTAADAAIAAAAALAVTEPMMTGPGGDCFALFYDAATRKVTALNGSGRAPAALTSRSGAVARTDLDGAGRRAHGDRARRGRRVDDLSARHGRLPVAACSSPRSDSRGWLRGWPVGPGHFWESASARLIDKPGHGAGLLVDGRAVRAGETFRNPALARTLREIAKGGKDAFYRGPIAEAIVGAVKPQAA